jgi:hypothetical protein
MTTVTRWGLLAALLLHSGCASFHQQMQGFEPLLTSGQPGKALQILQKQRTPARNEVLTLLNRGMILRMQGEYKASNQAFERAKLLSKELSAVSLTEQAGALTINDTLRSYAGDPYEQVLLHLFMAFNYLDLNDPGNARVETLQLDTRLRELAGSKSSNDIGEPFARYFAGLLYESQGEWDNALISYRMAYQGYRDLTTAQATPMPDALKKNLLRMTRQHGTKKEYEAFRKTFAINTIETTNNQLAQGKLIVIVNNGLAPVKGEMFIDAFSLETGMMHRIATPFYTKRSSLLSGIRVRTDNKTSRGALVHNTETIAINTLERQMPIITTRALARAVIKHNAAEKAGEQNGWLGLLANVTGLITERADTRSWATLPSNIHLAELALSPGQHQVQLEFIGANGHVVETRHFPAVNIARDKSTFLIEHRVAPGTVYGSTIQ